MGDKKEFTYSFRGKDRIIEEKGKQFIRFAEIAWNIPDGEECDESKIKYDLRKYTVDADGNEKMGKGLSFLTKEGPSELVDILIEEGFGNTTKILTFISKRSNFKDSVSEVFDTEIKDDDTFDLRDIIGG